MCAPGENLYQMKGLTMNRIPCSQTMIFPCPNAAADGLPGRAHYGWGAGSPCKAVCLHLSLWFATVSTAL